jgi:hypothetical protein
MNRAQQWEKEKEKIMDYMNRIAFLILMLLSTTYINYAMNKKLTHDYIINNATILRSNNFVYCKFCKKSMKQTWFNGGHKNMMHHKRKVASAHEKLVKFLYNAR